MNAALKKWLWGRQLIDVVRAFPIRVSAQIFVDALKRLQPRLYSIASRSKAHLDQVHLTVGAVRYAFENQARSGVCSGFLADRASQHPVPIFVQKSGHFRLPADTDRSVIMVGPVPVSRPSGVFYRNGRSPARKARTGYSLASSVPTPISIIRRS